MSACRDILNDPLALAVAPETHGALLLVQELASVPHLLSAQGLAGEGAAEIDAWWESWTLSEEDGARLRSRTYPAAARRLFPALGEEGLRGILEGNEASLRAVESLGVGLGSEPIQAALRESRRVHGEASRALEAGDGEGALGFAFRSVDVLREISPEQVAQGLVEKATEAWRRNQDSLSYSEEELTRIRRLTMGAMEALEEGDYPQAIRRAYYACQLLGADPT